MNNDELVLKSKFATFFISKQIFGFGIGAFVIFWCLYNSLDEKENLIYYSMISYSRYYRYDYTKKRHKNSLTVFR